MDKNNIKKHLVNRFVNEGTPGIDVTRAVLSKSKAFNDEGLKDIEDKLKSADKGQKKSASKTTEMPQNKFNYENKEAEYHQQMEIMNGQEMLEYDRDPNQRFKERAVRAIEGHPTMGNSPDYANVYQEEKGFTGPTFGKKLVQAIKNSAKKRLKATDRLISFGTDIEKVSDNYAPMAKFSALYENFESDEIASRNIEYGKPYGSEEENEFYNQQKSEKDVINYEGYEIYLNDRNYYNDPQFKYAFHNPNDYDESMGFGASVEECMEEIDVIIDSRLDENKNNKKTQIKEGMKRLKFKHEFKGVGNALKLIPESYKVDNKVFEMTDGVESYRMRWEGNINEGRAVVLMASDKTMVNEDMQKMKHLMGYKSQETLGTVKGKARIDENKIFSDIWKKSVILIEGEDIESQKAPEKKTDEKVAQSGEAKKHVHGSVSTDKGTKAPAAKTGSADSLEKVKSYAPEAKKAVQGSVEKKVGIGLGDQAEGEGNWDEVSVPQAAEAKKHVHMREGIKLGESYFAPMDEAWMEEMMHGGMEEGIYEDEDEYVDYNMGDNTGKLPNPPREINIPDLESGDELPASPTGGEYGGEFGSLKEDMMGIDPDLKMASIEVAEDPAVQAKIEKLAANMSPEEIERLQSDIYDTIEKLESQPVNEMDMNEDVDINKIANAVKGVASGLVASTIVPIIPVAIGAAVGSVPMGAGIFGLGVAGLYGIAELLKRYANKNKQMEEGMYGEGMYGEDIDEMYTFEEGDSIGEMYIDED